MSKQQRLTKSQERRRIEGLRILARIIARHYLAHPELYPNPTADGPASPSHGQNAGDGTAAGLEGGNGT